MDSVRVPKFDGSAVAVFVLREDAAGDQADTRGGVHHSTARDRRKRLSIGYYVYASSLTSMMTFLVSLLLLLLLLGLYILIVLSQYTKLFNYYT